MKKNKILLTILLLASIGAIYGINRVFRPFDEQIIKNPANLGSFYETGTYLINSKTILRSLSAGNEDIFIPKSDTSLPSPPVSNGPSPDWHQSEYIKITNALHQFIWSETLDTWKVYYLGFETNCNNVSNGFYVGQFVYFKTTWYNGSIFYSARSFLVLPLDNEISWGGDTYFPHPILGWKNIDLEKTKIDADTALLIAEENGGKAFRSSITNNCSIRLDLSGDYGWNIRYRGSTGLTDFEIFIDPYTGRIKK